MSNRPSRTRSVSVAAAMVACTLATSVHAADWAPNETLAGDLESGFAFAGYNNIRIPGDGGTKISFTDDLNAEPTAYFRFQIWGRLGERHTVRGLAAPLVLSSHGTVDRPIRFADATFSPGSHVYGYYRFDSYRLTYRYSLWLDPAGELALGATAKIRSAAIRLEGAGVSGEKTDLGFVPLLHVMFRWRFAYPWSLLLEADALAAPQGRAEDVLVAFEYDLGRTARIHAGYRLLEGGADNREVYTFTLVHYASFGVTVHQ